MNYLFIKEHINTYKTLCKEKIDNVIQTTFSFYERNQICIDYWVLNTMSILSCVCGALFLIGGGLLYIVSNTVLSLWSYMMEKTNRKRIIMDRVEDEPYLVRYYIFLKDRPDAFPFNIFIHKFLKSDPEELHDHPWGFFTIILSGGYWEYTDVNTIRRNENELSVTETTTMKHWRGPGFFQKVDATHKHRIELKEDVTAWTLFIPFTRVREWGFFTDGGWVENEKYLKNKQEEHKEKKND